VLGGLHVDLIHHVFDAVHLHEWMNHREQVNPHAGVDYLALRVLKMDAMMVFYFYLPSLAPFTVREFINLILGK
jgi:hypothetical protein